MATKLTFTLAQPLHTECGVAYIAFEQEDKREQEPLASKKISD
jgi:hypothetical protein